MSSEQAPSNDVLRAPRLPAARLRRVAGHSKLLWFLPCFVPVLALVCAVIWDDPDQHGLSRFWAAVTAAFAGVSLLAGYYRHLDRRFLRWLFTNADAVRAGSATFAGQPVRADSTVVRYEVRVGLVLIEAAFCTPYRLRDDPGSARDRARALILTLLLGWWSLPFGPFFAVFASIRNLKGGLPQSASELLVALSSAS